MPLDLEDSPRKLVIELEHGKPVRDVALDMLREHREWGLVADALGVSRQTLRRWRKEWASQPNGSAAVPS